MYLVFPLPSTNFRAHYNIVLNGVKIGGTALDLPLGLFETSYKRGAIIDSGTTLAYLPESIYLPLVGKVLSNPLYVKLFRN